MFLLAVLCYACGYGIVYIRLLVYAGLSLFIKSRLYVYMVVCVVYVYNLTVVSHVEIDVRSETEFIVLFPTILCNEL